MYRRLSAGSTITVKNGMDVVKNIKKMFKSGDGHGHVLAASRRHVDHLFASFATGVELTTVPAKVKNGDGHVHVLAAS